MTLSVLLLSFTAFLLTDVASLPKRGVFPVSSAKIDSLYIVLAVKNSNLPDADVFRKAMEGLRSIREKHHASAEIVSIIDFTKPSTEKRFWIIDIENAKVLHHTLVAHGKNSGELYATRFSNTIDSKQSSLGLFITGNTYTGKHGLSLKLHGLQSGVNDLAEARAIVIHSADYVSEQFIKGTGRLGRSFGCPAIPIENHKEIINTLANGSCLYIHYASTYSE